MTLKHWRLALFLVGCLAFLLHAEAINNELVFDDHQAIRQNPTIVEDGSPWRILTSGFWGREKEHYVAAWRPLATLTFVLNHAVHGLSPAGYHLVNILLHALVTVLVALLGVRLGLSQTAALASAAFFAVHPVHADAIVPGVGRADLLLGLLSLAALLLREAGRFGLALAALALALLSKEMGVVPLGVILLREWTRDGLRLPRPRPVWRTAALLALLAGWLTARYLVLGRLGKGAVGFLENPVAAADWLTRFWTAGALYAKALSLFAVPRILLSEYSYAAFPPVTGPSLSAVAGWILLLWTAVLAGVLIKRRFSIAVAVLLWLGGFALVSHLGPTIPMIFAERVMYLPSAGLMLMAGFAVDALATKPARTYAVYALIGLMCCAYGARSVYRVRDWRDDLTLMEAAVENAPTSVKHLANAVTSLYTNRRISKETAVTYAERALRIKEDDITPHLAAVQLYADLDEPEKARAHIQRAKEISPKHREITKAECVFAAKYSRETAVQKCREAVKRSPWDPMTWGYLAVSLDHRGEPDRAAIAFKLAMRHMRAPDISIFFNFGVFLARHRRYDKARQMFSAILKVDPENTRAEEYLEEIDDILRRMARGKPAS